MKSISNSRKRKKKRSKKQPSKKKSKSRSTQKPKQKKLIAKAKAKRKKPLRLRDKRGRFKAKPFRDKLGRFAKAIEAIKRKTPPRDKRGKFKKFPPRDKQGRYAKAVIDAEKIIITAEEKAQQIIGEAQRQADEIRVKSLIDSEWTKGLPKTTKAEDMVGDLMRNGYGPEDISPTGNAYYLDIAMQSGEPVGEVYSMFRSPERFGIEV